MIIPAYFAGIPANSTLDHRDLVRFCDENRSQVLASLPWIAAEIAGLESFISMFEMQRFTGGRRLYLSNRHTVVERKLGISLREGTFSALRKGSQPTCIVDIPSSWGVFTAIRRAGIFIALGNCADHKDILKRFGVSRRVLNTYRAHKGQKSYNRED